MTETHAEIGKMLKSSREAMKVRIEDASHALHIRTRYLQALEAGSLEDLPGRAYAKGYLLAYAGYLEMDKDELIRQFEKIEANFKRGFFLPEVLKKEKSAKPILVWIGIGVAVIAYILWANLAKSPYAGDAEIAAAEQQLAKNGHISALMAQNLPCLKLEVVLYPPCYAVEPDYSLFPLKRRVTSVMELKM
jgi:cytoskeletal protein RodZ